MTQKTTQQEAIRWKVENARSLDGVQFPPNLMNNTTCPLILLKPDGRVICATRKKERREVVELFHPDTDILLMAWPGQYETDVFRVDEFDLKKAET